MVDEQSLLSLNAECSSSSNSQPLYSSSDVLTDENQTQSQSGEDTSEHDGAAGLMEHTSEPDEALGLSEPTSEHIGTASCIRAGRSNSSGRNSLDEPFLADFVEFL